MQVMSQTANSILLKDAFTVLRPAPRCAATSIFGDLKVRQNCYCLLMSKLAMGGSRQSLRLLAVAARIAREPDHAQTQRERQRYKRRAVRLSLLRRCTYQACSLRSTTKRLPVGGHSPGFSNRSNRTLYLSRSALISATVASMSWSWEGAVANAVMLSATASILLSTPSVSLVGTLSNSVTSAMTLHSGIVG